MRDLPKLLDDYLRTLGPIRGAAMAAERLKQAQVDGSLDPEHAQAMVEFLGYLKPQVDRLSHQVRKARRYPGI